jgi:hypothetical protein
LNDALDPHAAALERAQGKTPAISEQSTW